MDTPPELPTSPATTSAPGSTASSATPSASKKKGGKRKFVTAGRVYVQATYNNTIITITDQTGAVIAWSSAGKMGFKGPKKSTPYAAGSTVRDLVDRVRDVGLKNVEVFVRGVGSGREAAVRALGAQGLNITSIKDITPIPHNGCRPPKVRRV
ncbi:MAG: 30S ribosomal protein S11 [Candidatus Kerfeldbacteria bacterium]|nr:30S ribosomal protein S11 [Candidatus Kerfeldbacteria bacterium]